MRSLSIKRELLFVAGVAFFLLLVGGGVYQILYPVEYWIVECVVRDTQGKVVFTRESGLLFNADQIKEFITWAEKLGDGETCKVVAIRRRNAIRLFPRYSPGQL